MKRLIFGCSLVLVFTFLASMPCAIAQEAAPPPQPCIVQVLSKDFKVPSSGPTSCAPCQPSQQQINRDFIVRVIVLNSNPLCDETLPLIPDGSKIEVEMRRIVRIKPVADKCDLKNLYWGSFTGKWKLIDPLGTVLFTGTVYNGTIGTCAHKDAQMALL